MPAKSKTPATPAPRQARHYPTLEEWCGNSENQAFVKQLLFDPRFLALLHYSKEIHRVTVDDLAGKTAMLNECIIRKAAIHAGACAFEETLRNLLKTRKTVAEPEPWQHIIPELQ